MRHLLAQVPMRSRSARTGRPVQCGGCATRRTRPGQDTTQQAGQFDGRSHPVEQPPQHLHCLTDIEPEATLFALEGCPNARPHPPEFRQRAVELARLRDKPVAQIAEDLGISDSCLRNWMTRADIDEGRREGLSSRERDELVELRREARTLKLENEILKRAAAYFARENVLPK
jgi:transposase